MKKLTKIIGITSVALLSVGLVGCGNQSSQNSSRKGVQTQKEAGEKNSSDSHEAEVKTQHEQKTIDDVKDAMPSKYFDGTYLEGHIQGDAENPFTMTIQNLPKDQMPEEAKQNMSYAQASKLARTIWSQTYHNLVKKGHTNDMPINIEFDFVSGYGSHGENGYLMYTGRSNHANLKNRHIMILKNGKELPS